MIMMKTNRKLVRMLKIRMLFVLRYCELGKYIPQILSYRLYMSRKRNVPERLTGTSFIFLNVIQVLVSCFWMSYRY